MNTIHLIYIGLVVYKYIGHESRSTSIGTLSEVWVGGRRGSISDSDWGEDLRTTGPGPHTTPDLTHVRISLGRMDC